MCYLLKIAIIIQNSSTRAIFNCEIFDVVKIVNNIQFILSELLMILISYYLLSTEDSRNNGDDDDDDDEQLKTIIIITIKLKTFPSSYLQ